MRNVVLASPEELFIAKNIEGFLKSSPGITSEIDYQFSGKGTKIQGTKKAGGNIVPGSEVGASQSVHPVEGKNIVEKTIENKDFYSSLSPKLKLDLSSRLKPESLPDYKLDLSPSSAKAKGILSELERKARKRNPGPLKFSSGFSNIPSSGGAAFSGSYGARRGVQRARASFKVEGYNLTPWAEKIVNKILVNWIIPSDQKMSLKGVVGISATIEKNGELSSITIVSSSTDQFLDEAALKALRLSSPLPGLPDDFPNKNLEAYFEFHYND